MREIKFRAWDGKEIHENVVIVDGRAFKNEKFAGKPMQYTGLKDENGQEIYEGDIVRRELSRPWEIKHFGQVITGVVKYLDDSYWIDFDVDATNLFCEIDPVEIIGNNYENPELLGVAE
ncbi:YopX family protein [Sporosarcina sp. FSL K6-1540]|uniref:YopX family protein n=1 Tax=Sporosarcina sp. FSL K6-1540 TaxID=2921555 RepID=UPI00315A746D